jgi:hypothetical protein
MRDVDNILVSAKLGSKMLSSDYTLRRKEKGLLAALASGPVLHRQRGEGGR